MYVIIVITCYTIFLKQLSSEKVEILDSNNFTTVNKDNINFLKDVHSWKWYFACGKRMMVVGVGVSLCVTMCNLLWFCL